MFKYFALVIAFIAIGLQAEVELIKNGKILDDTFLQGKWKTVDQTLQAEGTSNRLTSLKMIAPGDFSIRARLSIQKTKATASGFILGGNLLGFDSRSGTFFMEGADFPKKNLGKNSNWIKAEQEFSLKVTREGSKLSFFIDEKKLTSFNFHADKVPGFGFRPHRNQMKITAVSYEGGFIEPPKLRYIFPAKTDGYKSFRIPSLIRTKKGTLLAFAEGRVNGWGDAGNIDLVQKSSKDNGKTWSELKVIRDIKQTAGNPCPIIDKKTGRIIMVFCESDKGEHSILKGHAKRRAFVMHSDDDGESWSEPKNITEQANPEDQYNWLASGPGVGIQICKGKYKGRLVVPMANSVGHKYGVHTIYSDDNGATWKSSERIPAGCNESQLVELGNGQLMLNMRMQQNGRGKRGISLSKDGGKTWSELEHDDELNDPRCQASIIRYGKLLIFSNPATGGRRGMSVRISKDFAETWATKHLIYPFSSAYSCLAVTKDKQVACLFEGGIDDYVHHGIGIIIKPLKDYLKPAED